MADEPNVSCSENVALQYNGITWPSYADIRVTFANVYTDSGLAVKYLRVSVQATAILGAECICYDGEAKSQDDLMRSLRQRLSKEGAPLSLYNTGFGNDLTIQAYGEPNNDRWDVLYGPRPRILQMQPMGANKASLVAWSVEFHIRRCDNEPGNPRYGSDVKPLNQDPRVIQFDYAQNWSISNGQRSRTTQGTLEIIGSHAKLQGGSTRYTAPVTADQYWQRILDDIRVPFDGACDRQHTRTVSPDGRTLLFTITDSEMTGDNPVLPYIYDPNVTFNVNTTNLALAKWHCTLSGSFGVSKKVAKRYAWDIIFMLFQQKTKHESWVRMGRGREWEYGESAGREYKDGAYPNSAKHPRSIAWVTHMQFSENLFQNRHVSFSLSWMMITSFQDFIGQTKIFAPLDRDAVQEALNRIPMDQLPGRPEFGGVQQMQPYSWLGWRTSIDDLYGGRDLAGRSEQREIITLCEFREPPPRKEKETAPSPYKAKPDIIANPVPPEHSWIDCKMRFRLKYATRVIPHRILQLPEQPEYRLAAGDSKDFYKIPATDPKMLTYLENTQPDDNVYFQRDMSPALYVVFEGAAVRIGRGIPRPRLLWLGANKIECELIGDEYSHEVVGHLNDQNIYGARWKMLYYLPRTPIGDLESNYKVVGDILKDTACSPTIYADDK